MESLTVYYNANAATGCCHCQQQQQQQPEILVVLYIDEHVYKNIHWIVFVTQVQTVHSRAGNRYTYMKSKSKNITTSTNASGDLLTTQTTTTIMSTNLFTTSMPTPLSAIICECGDTTWRVCPYGLSIYMECGDTPHFVISIWIQIWICIGESTTQSLHVCILSVTWSVETLLPTFSNNK